MVRHTSIRILLALVIQFDMKLELLDVKTAFSHGTLDEEIYMSQPKGFLSRRNESKVCLLKKFLYEMKQSQEGGTLDSRGNESKVCRVIY